MIRAALLLALIWPDPIEAQCRMASAGRCISVPPSQRTEPRRRVDQPDLVEVGDILERGQYSIMMDRSYYGLPPVENGWVYMHIGDEIYRVDWATHEVLEKVTWWANRNFRG